jgi:hypothetical protein
MAHISIWCAVWWEAAVFPPHSTPYRNAGEAPQAPGEPAVKKRRDSYNVSYFPVERIVLCEAK